MATASTAITGATVVVRQPGVATTEIDGELLTLVIDLGKFFAIQGAGTRIWALIEQPIAVSDLLDRLMAEFEVGRAQCEAETIAVLERFLEAGLASEA